MDNTSVELVSEKTLYIHNKSEHHLDFTWQFVDSEAAAPSATPESGGLGPTKASASRESILLNADAFTFIPSKGRVWANTSFPVTVTFCPTVATRYARTASCLIAGRYPPLRGSSSREAATHLTSSVRALPHSIVHNEHSHSFLLLFLCRSLTACCDWSATVLRNAAGTARGRTVWIAWVQSVPGRVSNLNLPVKPRRSGWWQTLPQRRTVKSSYSFSLPDTPARDMCLLLVRRSRSSARCSATVVLTVS